MNSKFLLIVACSLFYSIDGFTNEANILKVDVSKISTSTYRFDVTVLHKDTGWDHYVNKWDIVDLQNNLLATRILYHPHVDEQPFTRSLSDIHISDNINVVKVRAHDLIHGYGGKELTVTLPKFSVLPE